MAMLWESLLKRFTSSCFWNRLRLVFVLKFLRPKCTPSQLFPVWYINPQPFFFPGSEKLAILYEQWCSCEGFWKESSLYKELKVKTHHRRLGRRVWMTFGEISKKYNSDRVATRIVEAKRNDAAVAAVQIRDHPDCPGDPDSRLKLAKPLY